MLILLFKTINTINSFEYKNITAEAEKMAQGQNGCFSMGPEFNSQHSHGSW